MPEQRHRHEKDEKEEKEEKGRHEKQEKEEKETEEKWRRDPLSGIFFGLAVIAVGIILLLATQGNIDWSDFWAYILVVIGGIFIIDALLRLVMPAYRKPISGKLIAGLILIAIGASNIYNIGTWWPLIIIAVGVVIVLSVFFRHMRPRE